MHPLAEALTFTHISVNPGLDAPGTAEVPRVIQLGFPRFDGLAIRRATKMWVMIRAEAEGLSGPLSVKNLQKSATLILCCFARAAPQLSRRLAAHEARLAVQTEAPCAERRRAVSRS
jgi:hypothetical protein